MRACLYIAAFVEGNLSPERWRELLAHVLQCPSCGMTLVAMTIEAATRR